MKKLIEQKLEQSGTAALGRIENDKRPDFLLVGDTDIGRRVYDDPTCASGSPNISFGRRHFGSVQVIILKDM